MDRVLLLRAMIQELEVPQSAERSTARAKVRELVMFWNNASRRVPEPGSQEP